MNSSLKSS
uniref:Uncharacterized protein n=1 Tax=Arundo donax TaxID=35708 RepID=A0A0A9GLG2_ARUDO